MHDINCILYTYHTNFLVFISSKKNSKYYTDGIMYISKYYSYIFALCFPCCCGKLVFVPS